MLNATLNARDSVNLYHIVQVCPRTYGNRYVGTPDNSGNGNWNLYQDAGFFPYPDNWRFQ